MEKCSAARESTDNNGVHEHFTLGTYGYKHTFLDYAIPIAFLLEQWLQERVSM